MQQFPDLQLIASGGVSSEEDIHALNNAGIPAVVFGKAIYEGKVSLQSLASQFLTTNQQHPF
jgi:phosphoribosylformimino-5-aminoimidazole carboxamide ribotide isomerase